uniref:Uncharacterized protein n=1 Tax=Glossina palpalis gambiensis TaxID=67801 RepID=A0A1B0BME2_9MUSC
MLMQSSIHTDNGDNHDDYDDVDDGTMTCFHNVSLYYSTTITTSTTTTTTTTTTEGVLLYFLNYSGKVFYIFRLCYGCYITTISNCQ